MAKSLGFLRAAAGVPLFCCTCALAQDEGLLSEQAFLKEMPVVLSASRLSQPLSESPTATTVIDRDMIEASGFRQIADLFRLVPGFYVTYVYGHKPIATYHGLADEYARRIQVLIDGRSVYMPPDSGVEWGDLPLAIEDIERIEVVRGPSAAAHGANSFLAVINIITRHPSQEQGTYLSLTEGEGGISDKLFRYGGSNGALDYRVTLAYLSDQGMKDYHEGIQKVYDPQQVKLASMSADYRLNTQDTMQFQLGYNGGSRGVGSKRPNLILHFRDVFIDSHFEQIRWQRTAGIDDELSVQLYHNYQRIDDVVLTDPNAAVIGQHYLDIGTVSQRYDLEVQRTLGLSRGWRAVFGGSARLDQAEAPLYFRQRVHLHQQRLFAHGAWNGSEKIAVNVGAMIEHNDIAGTDVSPRFSVHYHFAPHHTLRASVSRAYRTPVFLEEMGNRHFDIPNIFGKTVDTIIPPVSLRPEKILSREIGYVGEIKEAGLFLDLKLFRDQIGDLIGQLPVTVVPPPYFCPMGCSTFANLDSAVEEGLDAQVKFSPSKNTQITANYAHIQISGTNVEDTLGGKPNDQRLSKSAPVNSVSILAAHHFAGGFSASVGYYQQGYVRALGSGTDTNFYRRADLRLAQKLAFGKSKGEIALVMQNLLHESYSELREEFIFSPRSYATFHLEF